MEHWGAITYDEGELLYERGKSSQEQKERVFAVMAHEMAHQWFGNLVTMAWWDNLWLNEGFASWMESKTSDLLNPEWKTWTRAEARKNGLMARDARKSTHPIQRAVTTESQIGDAFDDITYGKGMFFIRMLEDYLGDKVFRAGLRRYMKRHAYSNTTTMDLWESLNEVSKKPVAEFAAGWTEQPGLPVIETKSDCVGGKQQLELRQERFTLLDPNAPPLRWKVPVRPLGLSNRRKIQEVVESEPMVVALDGCDDPVKINLGGRGYYRVSYDRSMFQKVRNSWSKMNEPDRVNFLGDGWSMVETGKLPIGDYLTLLPSVTKESSLPIWETMLTRLIFFRRSVPSRLSKARSRFD